MEIGQEIKETAPLPASPSSSWQTALPPSLPNQIELGGYETWLGTSQFEKHSSDALVKELLEMLGELWER
ncbi:MAG: hypothetical protein KDL87_14750 [Verrucomicrobiae bacterium]|nr:hypothetical protein [Verrucomicrobiae bacterium]